MFNGTWFVNFGSVMGEKLTTSWKTNPNCKFVHYDTGSTRNYEISLILENSLINIHLLINMSYKKMFIKKTYKIYIINNLILM